MTRDDDLQLGPFLRSLDRQQFLRVCQMLRVAPPDPGSGLDLTWEQWRDNRVTGILAAKHNSPAYYDAVIQHAIPASIEGKQLLRHMLAMEDGAFLSFHRKVVPKPTGPVLHAAARPQFALEVLDCEHTDPASWNRALRMAAVAPPQEQKRDASVPPAPGQPSPAQHTGTLSPPQTAFAVVVAWILRRCDRRGPRVVLVIAIALILGPFIAPWAWRETSAAWRRWRTPKPIAFPVRVDNRTDRATTIPRCVDFVLTLPAVDGASEMIGCGRLELSLQAGPGADAPSIPVPPKAACALTANVENSAAVRSLLKRSEVTMRISLAVDGEVLTQSIPFASDGPRAIVNFVIGGADQVVENRAGNAQESPPVSAAPTTSATTAPPPAGADDDSVSASGPQGGPFTPNTWTYTLANIGGAELGWVVVIGCDWLTASTSQGVLPPGECVEVQFALGLRAAMLRPGSYECTVTFVNTSNGRQVIARQVHLAVSDVPQP